MTETDSLAKFLKLLCKQYLIKTAVRVNHYKGNPAPPTNTHKITKFSPISIAAN